MIFKLPYAYIIAREEALLKAVDVDKTTVLFERFRLRRIIATVYS